jgi:hypothetical protein
MERRAACSTEKQAPEEDHLPAALVPVTAIPANYRRKHLPKYAHLCHVEGPAWDEADHCFIRIGGTRAIAAACRKLFITEEEAAIIFRALFQEEQLTIDVQPVFAAPSSLLPDALADLDTSRSRDLGGEIEQAMLAHALMSPPMTIDGEASVRPDLSAPDHCPRLPEVWYITSTTVTDDAGRRMVCATRLVHRFSGRSSGPVYTVWLGEETLAQARAADRKFETLDSHTQRVAVTACALAHGATLPVDEPEPAREVAITATHLEDDYYLEATKDPIYLRQEDILSVQSPEMILETALAAIEREQAFLRAVMDQRRAEYPAASERKQRALLAEIRADAEQRERLSLLHRQVQETRRWYRQRKRQRRRERILCLCHLEPRESVQWRSQPDATYVLLVGVPVRCPPASMAA